MTSSVDLEVLDARVFVDSLNGQTDLVEVVAEVLDGDTDMNTARAARTEVLFGSNDDADADRAAEWPDGFRYFPSVLEVYAAAYAPRYERAGVTARLLSALWSRGMAAVAVCEYEDLLPAAAGLGDRSLPWPTHPRRRA